MEGFQILKNIGTLPTDKKQPQDKEYKSNVKRAYLDAQGNSRQLHALFPVKIT